MIEIIVFLVIVGVVLYILGLIPMDGKIRAAIYALAILFLFLYVLQAVGLWHGFARLR